MMSLRMEYNLIFVWGGEDQHVNGANVLLLSITEAAMETDKSTIHLEGINGLIANLWWGYIHEYIVFCSLIHTYIFIFTFFFF